MKAPVPWCTWCGREKCSCEEPVQNVDYNPEPSWRDRVVAVVKRNPGATCSEVCEFLDVHYAQRDDDLEARREYDNVNTTLSRLARAGVLKAEGKPAQYTLVFDAPTVKVVKDDKPKRKKHRKSHAGAITAPHDLERAKRRAKAIYDERVAAHLCTRCGCSLDGLVDWTIQVCPDCKEWRRERDREYMQSDRGRELARARERRRYHKDPVRYRAAVNERRAELLAHGICRCGVNDVRPGCRECEPCLAKKRINKKAAMRDLYTRRRAVGLCFRCGAESPDRVNCKTCREKRAA